MAEQQSFTVPPQMNLSLLNTTVLNSTEVQEFRYSFPVTVFFCLAYTSVFIIGVIGNVLVVSVVLRTPRMRSPTNLFIANLALADLLVNFICLPFTLVGNVTISWKLGWLICKTIPYLQGVSVNASINTLVAISVERCLAICYPMKWRISTTVVKITVIVIWMISLSITFPWAVYFKYGEDSQMRTCTEEWPDRYSESVYFIVAHLFMCYILPLILISICYIMIWKRVVTRTLPGETHAHGEQLIQKSKMKVIKMLLVVIVLFACSWLPLYIICSRVKLGGEIGSMELAIIEFFLPIAQWLGTSNSCINPILYAFFNKKFRAGFKAIVSSRSCCSTLRYDYRTQFTISSRDIGNGTQKVPTKRMTISAGVPVKPKRPDPNLRTMSLRTPLPSNNNFQDFRTYCHDLNCNGTFV
nr:neuropeptide SIFamide receptor-like isoform X2 [Halyomorpha halys]